MSRTNIEGYPTSMLLDGDRLVVFSNVYTWNLPEGDPYVSFLRRRVRRLGLVLASTRAD